MLKLLLRLWWLQQRRNTTWKDILAGSYIVFVYAAMGVGFYWGATSDGDELFPDGAPSSLAAIMVLVTLLPDIFLKGIMKRDSTAMDDYIKARPLPESVWNKFLLLTNLFNVWNYLLPLLMLPVLLCMMSVPNAIAGYLLMQLYSYIDGFYVTCYRKTNEWMLRWPLVVGWLFMGGVLTLYLVISSWMPAVAVNLGMLVWAVLILVGLLAYLYGLKIYNEQHNKVSRFRTFGHTTLYSLQYIGLLRAKRVRNMVLVMVVVFFLDALLMAWMPSDAGGVTQSLAIYVVGFVLMPSVVLSQWTFGIEANYFQGLLTKPVRVERLLRNCYYFYLSISCVMALVSLTFLLMSKEVTVLTVLGALAMAVAVNLANLPTCLYSSRLEIFSNSMFNMQGANTKINLYGLLFLLPLAAFAGIYWMWGEMAWFLACILVAAVCLFFHKKVIALVAGLYERRRYQRMEKYMEA